jgi:RNA polymerase sigma-70 factor, ECF subfamily
MVMTSQSEEFSQRTEPFRRELLAHCYRMLGSADEAEDLVQETYLRAWRSYGSFEGRSSLRTWLYRIATNACLTALERSGRRALPSGLGAPADDPDAPAGPAEPELAWLGPIPDALVTPEAQDPAAILTARESLRLALIASLQYLPARQRAVLLLREVLGFSAAEVAAMLATSTAAVKSTLQRARARLDEVAPAPDSIVEPTEPHARELLAHYIAGFENSDTAALEKALRTDAAIELVGTRTWFSGRVTCLRYLAHVIGSPGDWLMTPTLANGQPAAAAYYSDSDAAHRAFGAAVLTATPAGISRITVFAGGPALVAKFGLPPTQQRRPRLPRSLWDDNDRDRAMAGQADRDRTHHTMAGMGRTADDDHRGVIRVGLVDGFGCLDQLLGDDALEPLERPRHPVAIQLRRGRGAKLLLDVVEVGFHLDDGVGRQHVDGGQVSHVDDLDIALAALQQPDRRIQRARGRRRTVVPDHQAQGWRRRRIRRCLLPAFGVVWHALSLQLIQYARPKMTLLP